MKEIVRESRNLSRLSVVGKSLRMGTASSNVGSPVENVREKRRVMGLFDKEPTNRIRACLPSPGSSSLLCFSALCRAGHNEIISIEIELSVRQQEVTEGEHEIEPADRERAVGASSFPSALFDAQAQYDAE